jgi:hypothetical protein
MKNWSRRSKWINFCPVQSTKYKNTNFTYYIYKRKSEKSPLLWSCPSNAVGPHRLPSSPTLGQASPSAGGAWHPGGSTSALAHARRWPWPEHDIDFGTPARWNSKRRDGRPKAAHDSLAVGDYATRTKWYQTDLSSFLLAKWRRTRIFLGISPLFRGSFHL